MRDGGGEMRDIPICSLCAGVCATVCFFLDAM